MPLLIINKNNKVGVACNIFYLFMLQMRVLLKKLIYFNVIKTIYITSCYVKIYMIYHHNLTYLQGGNLNVLKTLISLKCIK